jgi:hypothetical protein
MVGWPRLVCLQHPNPACHASFIWLVHRQRDDDADTQRDDSSNSDYAPGRSRKKPKKAAGCSQAAQASKRARATASITAGARKVCSFLRMI